MFVSVSRLLSDNPAQRNNGIAVTDIDGDGAFECFVCGFGHPNLVLKWGGDALFDVANRFLAAHESLSIGVAAADIDGDGREEIYVLNSEIYSDHLFAWRKGAWVNLFDNPLNELLVNYTSGRSVLAVDRHGLGRYGFLLASRGGPSRMFELMTADKLQDLATPLGLSRISGGQGLLAGPILSTRADIFAGNESGPNFLFQSQSNGTYIEAALPAGLADANRNARGAALLDANHDGRFDIVCANWEGPHRMFVQGASGRFIDLAGPAFAEPSRASNIIAADFDNDGYEEIFFNNLGQPNRLFAWRNGDWAQIDCGEALEVDSLGTGAIAADLNQDGVLELLISHDGAPLTLYSPNQTKNTWLRILPLTAAGAPARGAFVSLRCEGRPQIRVIDSGSGYLCQSEPVAHFGLGPATQVEWIEVRWLDGATQRILNPTIRQTLTIPYPAPQ